MTKHEKAVLRAAKARMKTLMAAYNFLTYDAVIYDQRGKKGPAAALIRATAKWLKASDAR